MPYGIFHQVAQDHLHGSRIGRNIGQGRIELDGQRHALAVPGTDRCQGALEPTIERHSLLSQRSATFNACQFQGLVDLRFQAIGIFQQPARQRGALIAFGNGLGLQPNTGQRCAQLMGNGRKKCLHAARAPALAHIEPGQQRRHRQQQHQKHTRFTNQHQARTRPLRSHGAIGAPGNRLQLGDQARLAHKKSDPPGAEAEHQ